MSTLDARVESRISSIRSEQGERPQLLADIEAAEARLASMSMPDEPEAYLQLRDDIADLRMRADALETADVDYLLQAVPFLQQSAASTAPTVKTPFDKIFGVKVGKSSRKGDVLNGYLLQVEKDSTARLPALQKNQDEFRCPCCQGILVVDTHLSTLVCPECGLSQDFMENSARNLTYDQEQHMSRVTLFSYKRANHLLDWLQSINGTENTEIAPEVLDALRAELRKDRVTSSDQITAARISSYLRKLKLPSLYEHATHIAGLLNGDITQCFTPEITARLLAMFNAIQEPFDRHKHINGRSNSLSYPFIIFKMCELLELDFILPRLKLLKCNEKLFSADKLWCLICKDLRWQFIPTI